MIVIGLDPGTEQSALVALNTFPEANVRAAMTVPNNELRLWLKKIRGDNNWEEGVLAIEMIASYGMAVGRETFETCVWVGRFVECWDPESWDLIYRRDVKLNLCHSARATDSNIREAILDRFGPGKSKAVGIKSAKGPLYGLKGHEFAALAVALTWSDLHGSDIRPDVKPDF